MSNYPRASRHLLIAVTAALALMATACNRGPDRSASTTPATPPAASNTPPASDTGRSVTTRVDDAAITAKVKTALLAESNVPGTAINVDTTEGKVTLRGKLDSQAQIDRAVQVARGVDGVRDVDNQLTTS